jgi:ribosomal subunit interface protein
MGIQMEIIVRGRHVTVAPRFRQHAIAKLARLEKLDAKAVRIDVEVSEERNPRQADHRERVELTIRSRGPAIRAEAAADDRYTALDLALAKIESRLRRASDRRKVKHGDNVTVRSPDVLAGAMPAVAAAPGELAVAPRRGRSNGHGVARPRTGGLDDQPGPAESGRPDFDRAHSDRAHSDRADFDRADFDGADFDGAESASQFVPIKMEGDGPLVLREKVHAATPMTIDQALLEMELVGHDFYLFHDRDCDRFSVVYRRRGYDYGVIRLVEE